MTSRTAVTTAWSAGVLLATVPGAAPAHAADDIGLSPDGVVWYDALHRPLFDPAVSWVPGDVETASFYVRNVGPSAARLTIDLRDVRGVELLGADDIVITARRGGGRWLSVENGDAATTLTDSAIRQGGQTRVDVRIRFRWQAPNRVMLGRLPLDFEVRLVQAGPSDTGLPDTGSDIGRLVVLLAGILIGCGLALLAAARRTRALEVRIDG